MTPDFEKGNSSDDPSPSSEIDRPVIPDHELLRQFDAGSYGEVWLARSAMGALRAVKIVHRKTFQDDRPFNRELSGIRKFEPISRSHTGFIHILHIAVDKFMVMKPNKRFS